MLAAGIFCAISGSEARAASRVYLMRGLADVSTGLDVLAAKLKRRGIAVWVDSYTAEPMLAAHAIKSYKSGGGPIIIIGHSLGADAAIAMAGELKAAHVPVAMIVAFSPANSLDVPGNVGRLINYYQSNSFWNVTYQPSSGPRGSVRNIDLAADPNIDHFNIEKVERLHAATIAAIHGLGSGAKSPAPASPAPLGQATAAVGTGSKAAASVGKNAGSGASPVVGN